MEFSVDKKTRHRDHTHLHFSRNDIEMVIIEEGEVLHEAGGLRVIVQWLEATLPYWAHQGVGNYQERSQMFLLLQLPVETMQRSI